MDIENLIKSLENGICPASLNFSKKADVEIDWNKVAYNTFYHTKHFYEDKFPEGYESIPAFDKILDLIVEKNKDNSPLKEILERQIEKEENKEDK
jgi:hypothetical protein